MRRRRSGRWKRPWHPSYRSHNVAAKLYQAIYRRFPIQRATCTTTPAEMLVLSLLTNGSLAHVHRRSPQTVALRHHGTTLFKHSPSCLAGHSDHTLNLLGRDAATGGGDRVHGIAPLAKQRAALLEDRPGHGKIILPQEPQAYAGQPSHGDACDLRQSSWFRETKPTRSLRPNTYA